MNLSQIISRIKTITKYSKIKQYRDRIKSSWEIHDKAHTNTSSKFNIILNYLELLHGICHHLSWWWWRWASRLDSRWRRYRGRVVWWQLGSSWQTLTPACCCTSSVNTHTDSIILKIIFLHQSINIYS